MKSSSKIITAAVTAAALAIGLSACAPAETATTPTDGSLGTIKVGALETPAGDILKFVADNLSADAGLTIEFVPFTDYNTPNTALSTGEVDANLFQNDTFLANYNSAAGDDLISLGNVYLPSAAFYSDKVDSIKELKDGAKIAIPNDPTNEGRALKILAAKGLIEITDQPATLADITANPHNFEFVEIENATLPQAVPDVDAAFVTIAFALPAGLTGDDAILTEGEDSPYFNVLATRAELRDDPRVVKLLELLLSADTKQFLLDTWGGLVVPTA